MDYRITNLDDIDIEILKLYNTGKAHTAVLNEDQVRKKFFKDLDASPQDFKIIRNFFNGVDGNGNPIDPAVFEQFGKNANGEIVLTHKDLVDVLYKNAKESDRQSALQPTLGYSTYRNDTDKSYYAKIALALGSVGMTYDTEKVRYVIDSNGQYSIRNYKSRLADDNYDYASSNINDFINWMLKYDLSAGIDNKISIKYELSTTGYRDYSEQEFANTPEKWKKRTGKDMNYLKFLERRYQIIDKIYGDVTIPYLNFSMNSILPRKTNNSSGFLDSLYKTIDLFTPPTLSEKSISENAKNDFFSLTYQPTEKLSDGRFKFDPVYKNYGWGLYADTNTLNLDAYANRDKVDNVSNTFKSNILTDDFRITNGNLSETPIVDRLLPSYSKTLKDYTVLNEFSNLGKSVLPTDPLILDLNGDGIRLSSYNSNKILFDIDNDGGSLEQTGWLNANDGFLVNDLNKNGKIDNISEIFSEFYAGKVGKNGETGEKRFKTGFDALKTLDSNKDGVFDKKDKAWNTVRVWKDKNQNGQTDKGELLTLASLKISKINLGYNYIGGEFYDGNEILARGNFVINGKTNQALSVNFLADPRGNTFTHLKGGVKVETQGDGRIGENSVFTSTEKGNTTLDAKKLGVKNIAAGVGNDVLKGDDGNNWLAGNLGSDTFYGGAGNDVLIIDGDDKAENIHGGEGEDIIQVVGNKAVNIDLFKAEVEAMQGGRGDDVIVSSGNKTIYVRGGDGDDTILGGFANDALSGENGNDFIMGNLGDDVIRGHRGNDYLIGNQGNDLIWGGSDDDMLFGGKGNDMLSGDSGDDYLDGEEGNDIVEYTGNLADYKIKKVQDGVLITDTVQGRDGTDFVRNVEKANFKDIKGYQLPQENDLGLDNPLPVMDIIDRDKNGRLLDGKTPYIISRQQLLANDIDLQNDKLDVTQLTNIKGGTVALNKQGDLVFTPTVGYRGIAGFKYTIEDANETKGLFVGGKERSAQVYFKTPNLPNDPLFYQQYYLDEANVLPVWDKYTGKGVRIGQFEPSGPFSVAEEVADYRNPELRQNIDKEWLYDYEFKTRENDKVFSKHATEVAGVMVAARNGEGGIGVAYNATTASHWVGSNVNSLLKMKNYDVANHSWGHSVNFARQINFTTQSEQSSDEWFKARYISALSEGRHGLGTVIVNSSGNERRKGGDANYSYLTNNPYTVVVGSAQLNEDNKTVVAPYSNAGANVLVSAHGSDVVSSSRRLINENGGVLGDNFSKVDGTSFSAPIVSGVVALMLEANPNLGYRDVQEILSLSARAQNTVDGNWQWNGDKNWNGGGRHVSHDLGYGIVDANAAVRLAENWHKQNTYSNEQRLEKLYKSGTINQKIEDNSGRQFSVNVNNMGLNVENVSIQVNLEHSRPGDLTLKLISPSGTESILMNRPGVEKENKESVGDKDFNGNHTLNYSFNTTLLRGENPNGKWLLQIFDSATGKTGVLHDWSMSFYGSVDNGNDTYVYTDEYKHYQAIKGRNILADTDNGNDIINTAAISGAVNINLSTGKANLNQNELTIQNPNTIEGIIAGDFNDTLIGNAQGNLLIGGRGNDTLSGMDGNDILYGAQGNNRITGGNGADIFVVNKNAKSTETITDFKVGTDKLILAEFPSLKKLNISQSNKDAVINLGNGQTVRLLNVKATALSLNNVVIMPEKFNTLFLEKYSAYGFASNNKELALPDVEVVYWGSAGNDRIFAGNKGDTIYGGLGDDVLVGEHSTTQAEGGNDTLYGGEGNDIIRGGAGNDIIYGGQGLDNLGGDAGDDIIYLEGDDSAVGYSDKFYNEHITLNNVELNQAITIGGSGNDRFVVVKDTSKGVGKGLLKNVIADFDPNNPNERIDLSQFNGGIDIKAFDMFINGERYSRVWFGKPSENTQYVMLKGVKSSQLSANFFTDTSNAILPKLKQRFIGNNKNNTLKGNAVSNYFDGKAGTDTMIGYEGDDTYIVDNAKDNIIETPQAGYDIVKSSVSYQLKENIEELQLLGKASINGTGNRENNRIVGNAGNNTLNGGIGDDTLIGGKGNDTYIVDSSLDEVVEKANEGTDKVISSVSYTLSNNLENLDLSGKKSISGSGNSLNNHLNGNNANNRLIGYEGNDTLQGRKGNDFLMGGKGNDTYIFSRGDGNDIIMEESGSDKLVFNKGINHNQLWFKKSDDDLVINVIGTTDNVIVNNWYKNIAGENHKVESIVSGNGKKLTEAQLNNLVNAMASFAVPPAGQINLSNDYHTKLDNVLAANWK